MFDVLLAMKTPPFLLLAALLFWGWQSHLLLAGALMGVVLESARFITSRWEFAEEDFRRILTFCTVLALALLVYAVTANQEGGGLTRMIHASPVAAVRNTGIAATAFLRWLPMTVFLFVTAQMFSERGSVPLSAISDIFRWRRRRQGGTLAERNVDVSYPYFMLCLFSAGVHANEGTQSYFWGICVLLAWALWSLRPRRSALIVWLCAFGFAVALGYSGVRGVLLLVQAADNFNARWISRLFLRRTDAEQSFTAIGQIGYLKLSPRIVIRLKPKDGSLPPEYLREASYRYYSSTTWRAGVAGNEFTAVYPSSTIFLPRKTTARSVVNIACYLDGYSKELGAPEGLLPLPTGCSGLENTPSSLAQIKINKTGAVLAAGPGLMIFDARFGPGATVDSPPDTSTNQEDLTVPTNEIPALREVVSELKISGANEEQKLQAIRRFFADNFSYSVWIGPVKPARTNETPLARFLLHSRSGHCEYFATATVLLLRELDIPARYAVGYYVHERSGTGYVVRERDAHAWCLVWNEQTKTWQDFDTTPASWIAAENDNAPATQWLSDVWSWIRFQIARFRYGQTNLRTYILWALVPVMALLLYQIIFRNRKQRRAKSKAGAEEKLFRQGLDSEFYQLENRLAARGVPRQPGELLSDWLARALAKPSLAELREPLQKLLQLHYRHRFDPRGLSADERENLKREAKRCLDILLRTNSRAIS
jgi:hypothetical protein